MNSLNKTVAKFNYEGQDYEIDWLTDQDFINLDGISQREFDVFCGSIQVANFSDFYDSSEQELIKSAIEALEVFK